VTPLDVDLLRAWLAAEPARCCGSLPRLTAEERLQMLEQMNVDDLARLLAHGPVWWVASVVAETPAYPWPDAIEASGLNPNLVHVLRALTTPQRESLLARIGSRHRVRVSRALALPKDRVIGVLDEHIRVCHADEPAGSVAARSAPDGAEDVWVYVTDTNDRYIGQLSLLELSAAAPERRVGELRLTQRPRIATTLLLADALRLTNWQGHDSLPAADEAGRFLGVLRLGALARALGIDDESPPERPFTLVGSILTLWVQLLVAIVSRVGRAP